MIWSFSSAGVGLGRYGVVFVLALAAGLAAETPAVAEVECRVVELDFNPTADLQIVAWLEDAGGNYIDTMYITRLTGIYGLGNRPGMMTFNSAWRWPYGRRINTFPVWAHRHGMEWPLVEFQNQDETNLSHPLRQSSLEQFYCRPLRDGEVMWDAQTCSSTVYTDKGVLSASKISLYPPRSDLTFDDGTDAASVKQFAELNPFDAVSRPTPRPDEPFQLVWPVPFDLPNGEYVVLIEVSKEFDQNGIYNYPAPIGIPWSDYGLPARGQPSVVYRIPFTLANSHTTAITADYSGYGDPDGLDGRLREPDGTITTGVDGSGASRLLLTVDGEDIYRVRVRAHPADDRDMPGAPAELQALKITDRSVKGSFVAPGDDLMSGTVSGYQVRYLVAGEIDKDNFARAQLASTSISPEDPGQVQLFEVNELVPRTQYTIAVRAYDECRNYGPLKTFNVITKEREVGEVGWCFVATAAYGSVMEKDVEMLRRFRDRFLRTHAAGELLVETYYTFGPALARLIGPSDTMRRAARAGLAPIVEVVRELSPGQ